MGTHLSFRPSKCINVHSKKADETGVISEEEEQGLPGYAAAEKFTKFYVRFTGSEGRI